MNNKKKTVFLVDDNLTNLTLGKNALAELYGVFTLNSGARLFKMLENVTPDIILLDVEMPEMDGYEVIKKLKSQPATAHIPVIFLTAKTDGQSEHLGLSLGAIDYITKPFTPSLLLKRIEVHLLLEAQRTELKAYNENLQKVVEEKTTMVVELKNAVLKTMAELVECRDDVTGGHIERTQEYLAVMVDALQEHGVYNEEVANWDIALVLQSAQLHDVGKIHIKDSILKKPGKLTPEEFEEIKQHAVFGEKVIDKIKERTTEQDFLEYAKTLIGSHHEKWDGSGYPHGLQGTEIPLLGRLMAIADVYDALVSDRPYKNAYSHDEAVEIIVKGRGTHFDPALIDLFVKNEDKFKSAGQRIGWGGGGGMKNKKRGKKLELLKQSYKQLAFIWLSYIAFVFVCYHFFAYDNDVMIVLGLAGMFQVLTSIVVLRFASAKRSSEERERQKSSFLANMSHEIRTPLNAIIGFAELALREDIPPAAYEHVFTIKQAGSNLLSIINGILDFSKIESGKLEIVESEYQFASLVSDVVSVIKVRATYERLRFVVNVDGGIPNALIGDEVKVRQAMLNVLSNAVKYTERGFIKLSVTGVRAESAGVVMLRVEVADSGKGIKKEDMSKLFNDYVRVDKTKNKNIEGTGLGLVITNNIVRAMGGSIEVESEYGAGSLFTINIPQKFNNGEAHAAVADAKNKNTLVYERREIYADSIMRTLENLGVTCKVVSNETSFAEEAKSGKYSFVFTAPVYCDLAKEVMANGGAMKLVLLAEFGDTIPDLNAALLSMPAYSVTVADVLNGTSDGFNIGAKRDDFAKFVAPSAKVLVVDDTNTNLRVAEGLLAPYKVSVTTCRSGLEAISAVRSERYDIVFMDHMMPGMDGIEATKQIRKLDGEHYAKLPIVALTANALAGAREMFLREGCSDFIAKPIDVKKLNAVLDKWIPPEKRNAPVEDGAQKEGDDAAVREVLKLIASTGGIDVEKGLALSGGSSTHYLRTMTVFYEDGFLKIEEIKRALETDDVQLYATHVHGLKSASASIGAVQLSKDAAELEALAKDKNKTAALERTPKFLFDLENILRDIGGALGALKTNAGDVEVDILAPELVKLKNALDGFDSEAIDKAAEALQCFENTEEFGAEVKDILQNVLVGEYEDVFAGIDKLLVRLRRSGDDI